MTSAIIGDNRVIAKYSHEKDKQLTYSAHVRFHFENIHNIADEFGIDRSREKSETILKGFKNTMRRDAAEAAAGRTFLIDTKGRELPPCLGHFSDEVLQYVTQTGLFLPNPQNELFEKEVHSTRFEAIQFKLWLKSILMFGQLIYTNEHDQSLMQFTVRTEPSGEGLIDAIFAGGNESTIIYLSITETTNFEVTP